MPNDYATPSLSPAASFNKIFEDSLVDLRVFNAVTFANLARLSRIKTTSDPDMSWEVRYGTATASSIPIYSVSGLQSNSSVAQANLSFATKRFNHRFQISRVKAGQAAAKGVGALRDLFGQHIEEAMSSILGSINGSLHTTNADSEIVALDTILDDTATYAGINPATVTEWTPTISKNGTARAFSRDLMIDFDAKVRTRNLSYDTVLMHPNTEARYKKLYMGLAGTISLPNYTNLGQLKAAELGVGETAYNNRPIILDPGVPESEIRMFNSNGIEMFFYDMPLGQRQPGMPQAIDEVVNNSLGFPMYICSYPITVPTVLEFELYTIAQMRVRNRQNAMAIKNLTTTSWVA